MRFVGEKKVSQPFWAKNTYFWIAGILVVVSIFGILRGEATIRDPGQRREGGLVFLYLGGAVLMLINGFLSHRQTVLSYEELQERSPE